MGFRRGSSGGRNALLAGPRLDQRAIDGEVLGREEIRGPRLREDGGEERLRDLAFEQAIAILREHGGDPHGVIDAEADEPAEQQIVVELLHELALAPHRVEHLKQERAEQLLRRDRRAAPVGVEGVEPRRERDQRAVDHRAHGTQRMVGGNALLQRDVAEHRHLLPLGAPHETRSAVEDAPQYLNDRAKSIPK